MLFVFYSTSTSTRKAFRHISQSFLREIRVCRLGCFPITSRIPISTALKVIKNHGSSSSCHFQRTVVLIDLIQFLAKSIGLCTHIRNGSNPFNMYGWKCFKAIHRSMNTMSTHDDVALLLHPCIFIFSSAVHSCLCRKALFARFLLPDKLSDSLAHKQ